MGLMDFLRRLVPGGRSGAGGEAAVGEPVDYKGYSIRPAPERTGSGWNTAGTITKEFPDGVKEHRFVRVDTHSAREDAVSFSVTKAQQIIDEQGDRLFQGR
jgi:hypothetical protein